MLLGAKGTSRDLPKAGCAAAVNSITAASIHQRALLNLLLRPYGEAKVAELFGRSDKTIQLHQAQRVGYFQHPLTTGAEWKDPMFPTITFPHFHVSMVTS